MFNIAFLLLQASNGQLPVWGGLGVGGALAGVILWFYVKREKEIVATLVKFTDSFQATIEKNAIAMTEVSASLRNVAGAISGCPLARSQHCDDEDGRQGLLLGTGQDKGPRL